MPEIPIDRRSWRKRWTGRRCMKIQIRDEHGSEVGIEAPLSEDQYAAVLRVCLDLVNEHATTPPEKDR